jgi:hypothetical protein
MNLDEDIEVPTCGKDKAEIKRDPTNGKWGKCGDDAPVNPCGDGLNPGVNRTEPEALECFGADLVTPETPQCHDADSFGDIIRLPDTGAWGCPMGGLDKREFFKVCGDGLTPGVDRALLA